MPTWLPFWLQLTVLLYGLSAVAIALVFWLERRAALKDDEQVGDDAAQADWRRH